MAANAFILVNVDPENTHGVVERLRGISGVVVDEVLGPYDLVVDVETDTQEEVTSVLRNKIRHCTESLTRSPVSVSEGQGQEL